MANGNKFEELMKKGEAELEKMRKEQNTEFVRVMREKTDQFELLKTRLLELDEKVLKQAKSTARSTSTIAAAVALVVLALIFTYTMKDTFSTTATINR